MGVANAKMGVVSKISRAHARILIICIWWPRGTLRTSILLSGIRNNKCRSPGLTTAQRKSIYRSPGLTPAVLDGLPYRYPDSRYPIPGFRNNKCRSPGLTSAQIYLPESGIDARTAQINLSVNVFARVRNRNRSTREAQI